MSTSIDSQVPPPTLARVLTRLVPYLRPRWAGLALAHQGDLETGVTLVERAIELHPGWRDLLGRVSQEIPA